MTQNPQADPNAAPEVRNALAAAQQAQREADAEPLPWAAIGEDDSFAAYWGGGGPEWEAQAERDAENEVMWWAENDTAWRERPGGEAEAEAAIEAGDWF